MYHKVEFVCKPNEVNRIRINCRCGHIEIHVLPKAIEHSDMLLVCPQCNACFVAVKRESGFSIWRLGAKNEVHFASPEDIR